VYSLIFGKEKPSMTLEDHARSKQLALEACDYILRLIPSHAAELPPKKVITRPPADDPAETAIHGDHLASQFHGPGHLYP
jgi:hypothetical protein